VGIVLALLWVKYSVVSVGFNPALNRFIMGLGLRRTLPFLPVAKDLIAQIILKKHIALDISPELYENQKSGLIKLMTVEY
jgi:hypothetical protein